MGSAFRCRTCAFGMTQPARVRGFLDFGERGILASRSSWSAPRCLRSSPTSSTTTAAPRRQHFARPTKIDSKLWLGSAFGIAGVWQAIACPASWRRELDLRCAADPRCDALPASSWPISLPGPASRRASSAGPTPSIAFGAHRRCDGRGRSLVTATIRQAVRLTEKLARSSGAQFKKILNKRVCSPFSRNSQ